MLNDNVDNEPKLNSDLKQYFKRFKTEIDPDLILKAAKIEIEGKEDNRQLIEPYSNLFKATTLNEFE